MNKVEYLEIHECEDVHIPVLHVVIKDDNNEIVKEGWLSPFRAYRFQVSGTIEGFGDYGSSEVIGLKHCIDLSYGDGIGYQSNHDAKGIGKQLLLGQALIAMTKWTGSKADLGDWETCILGESNQMTKFIAKCYDWLRLR